MSTKSYCEKRKNLIMLDQRQHNSFHGCRALMLLQEHNMEDRVNPKARQQRKAVGECTNMLCDTERPIEA